MAAQPIPRLSADDYLEMERASETRHEFFAGQMYDKAGGTLAHARLAGNLIIEFGTRLKGDARSIPMICSFVPDPRASTRIQMLRWSAGTR